MGKQYLSIEQMQHLKKLGVDTSNANFYWHRTKNLNNYKEWDEWELHYGVLRLARGFKTINCEYVRTFTLQDILDLLPEDIKGYQLHTEKTKLNGVVAYHVMYMYFGQSLVSFLHDMLIDAAYEMLCWVIENGYLKVK